MTNNIWNHTKIAQIDAAEKVILLEWKPKTPVRFVSIVAENANFIVLCEVRVEGYKYAGKKIL